MAPYRTVSHDAHAEPPRDPGIVGDVIAQFADPLAFYRELVQNAIDADSPAVEVELVHDTRVMLVCVRDRGVGMTRDILENQLLVLFRSTKEKDLTKIGKFGIGFASVLSPNPNVVVVSTARDGRRLVLHLSRDLTYKLYDGGPATQTGTMIELELAMTVEDAPAFAQRSHEALLRWCRHASVPIELRTELPGRAPEVTRIDRPLGLDDAIVEVRGSADDGQLQMIVGIARDAKPYAGFFNHGLMLHETTERLLGNLAFKIQDARLGHTLSRDNVRRDEHFAHALQMTRALAEEQLPRVIAGALRAAAGGPVGAWEAVARAVVASEIGLAPMHWTFPLVDGGSIDAQVLDGKLWSSATSTALTTALARAGVPIVRVTDDARATFHRLHRLVTAPPEDVATAFALVRPVQATAADQVLCDTLLAIFEACHRGPPRVELATIEGAHADLLAITGGREDAFATQEDTYVLARDIVVSTPFTRTRRRAVVLAANHALVRAARAASDPRMAAAHLARGVLLQHRILDVDKSRAILDYTLARVVGDRT